MSTVAELKKKTETLEAAYKHAQITAALLMQELSNGAVPCAELQRYNNLAKSIWDAQMSLWGKLALNGLIFGKLPAFPPGPVLFSELAPGEGLSFHCRTGADLVGPSQFKAVRFDKPMDLIFGPQKVKEDNLGLVIAPIYLVIAGITFILSAAVVTKVAIDASRDTTLAQTNLDALKVHSQNIRYYAEARTEFTRSCLKTSGGTYSTCAESAAKVIETMPFDPDMLGKNKFSSGNKTAWLLGGGLGVLGILGGAWLYHNRKGQS